MRISTHRKVSVALTITVPKEVKKGELRDRLKSTLSFDPVFDKPRLVITDWLDGVTGGKGGKKAKPKGKPTKKAVKKAVKATATRRKKAVTASRKAAKRVVRKRRAAPGLSVVEQQELPLAAAPDFETEL